MRVLAIVLALFGISTRSPSQETLPDAVLIHLTLTGDRGSDDERKQCVELEGRLENIVHDGKLGEFDGNEFGGGGCVFYIYGAKPKRILEALSAEIAKSPLGRRGNAVVREAGKEERVPFPLPAPAK